MYMYRASPKLNSKNSQCWANQTANNQFTGSLLNSTKQRCVFARRLSSLISSRKRLELVKCGFSRQKGFDLGTLIHWKIFCCPATHVVVRASFGQHYQERNRTRSESVACFCCKGYKLKFAFLPKFSRSSELPLFNQLALCTLLFPLTCY